MGQQLVDPSPDLHQLPRGLLLQDGLRSLLQVNLPVQVHDGLVGAHRILLDLASFEHQQRSPEKKRRFVGPGNSFFKRCPGWGANLGSFGFRLFSHS